MDKRTVYGFIADRGYWCLAVERCTKKPEKCPVTADTPDCTEFALCNPADLAKVEAEARIGRAVVEFVTRQKTADYYRRTTSDYERGYKDAVDAVEIAITKAREGGGNA